MLLHDDIFLFYDPFLLDSAIGIPSSLACAKRMVKTRPTEQGCYPRLGSSSTHAIQTIPVPMLRRIFDRGTQKQPHGKSFLLQPINLFTFWQVPWPIRNMRCVVFAKTCLAPFLPCTIPKRTRFTLIGQCNGPKAAYPLLLWNRRHEEGMHVRYMHYTKEPSP